MPLIDMSLEELREYQGSNPRPEDHEEYWSRALAEMRAVDPDTSMEPAEFQAAGAECFHLHFTGVGGSRIYAKYLRPGNIDGACPAIIQFHGYTGSSGEWSDKLAYVSQGIAVFALDVRGQSGRSEDLGGTRGRTHGGQITRGLADDPEKLYFRQVFLDTAQIAAIVMGLDEIDESRVASLGGSQGGALALVCAALEPRIYKAASCFPFLSDYKRVWEMDLANAAYEDVRSFFRQFDPTHARADEYFTRLGYIDVQHLAGRIRGDVLMGTGLMDQICPPSTQFAIYNKLKCKKEMIVYPDYGHEGILGWNDAVFQFLTG